MAAGSSEILPPQFSLDAVGETVDRASRNFVAGLHFRWLAIHGVPNDVAAFRLALADAGTTPALLALQVAATLLLVVGFYHMTVRALEHARTYDQ